MAGTAGFTYDANGNQTSKTPTASSQPILYAYDAANRLVNVTGGVFTSSFAYDGDGNRFRQATQTGTYSYVNDVATALPVVLQESGPDGNISYAYGLGLISETSSAFNYFYQYDGLGSVVGLTDSGGKLAGRYAYDAWGNADLSVPQPQVGTANKFRFTGEALDPGTQLYYLRARYYDPSVGQFLSQDLLRSRTSAYAYVRQNPISWVDPSGFSGVLTIYTNYNGSSLGHSWISFQPDGSTTTTSYGLYPSGLQNFDPLTADVPRNTYLTDAQQAKLFAVITANQWFAPGFGWLFNDCALFAAKAWFSATGEFLNPYKSWDFTGAGWPEALKKPILNANSGQTSGWLQQPPSSSSGAPYEIMPIGLSVSGGMATQSK